MEEHRISAMREGLKRALLSVDALDATAILGDMVSESSLQEACDLLLVPTLKDIGDDWEGGRAALSQVYMAGKIAETFATSAGMSRLPVGAADSPASLKVAIATLEDNHSLGRRLVLSALKAGGYSALDYGVMQAQELAERAASDDVDILLVSVLMLPSALKVRELRRHLDALGCTPKLVVGGAPFSIDPQLWEAVGADAMSGSAFSVVGVLQGLEGRTQ